jgi:hypothetical protein
MVEAFSQMRFVVSSDWSASVPLADHVCSLSLASETLALQSGVP